MTIPEPASDAPTLKVSARTPHTSLSGYLRVRGLRVSSVPPPPSKPPKALRGLRFYSP